MNETDYCYHINNVELSKTISLWMVSCVQYNIIINVRIK